MKSLPLISVLLATLFAGCLGCNDQPKLRLIGSQAPDFTVQDTDRKVSLHDYRGKIVVLNFWSAHCAPCIAEMPSLVQLQKRMGDKITVVGVAVDTTNDEYHAFLQKHGIDFRKSLQRRAVPWPAWAGARVPAAGQAGGRCLSASPGSGGA